jgi:histidine ammonia-lyase
MNKSIVLDGESLTVEQVVEVARFGATVEIDAGAAARVDQSRATIEKALADGKVIYGINTGFGKLAEIRISNDQVEDLQRNLIRSHVAGVGDPLPLDVVRGLMLLRANVLLKTTSGARSLLGKSLAAMLNAGIHPVVPEQGSVGACGDLAPLAHLGLAMMGEGDVEVTAGSTTTSQPASDALKAAGIEPIIFGPKEGLSFINGTQAQTSILALLVHDSQRLWRNGTAAAAMSLEALRGTPVALEERIHNVRPHSGQIKTAKLMRDLMEESSIRESHVENDSRVQDAYSLRCAPQIMGPVLDAIDFAAGVVEVELNSATDNPLVFGDEVISGGNFHGQPVAMALDFLAIALTTFSGVAERRVERLVNPDLSAGLPAFLTDNAGVQSGFMMVQITAASLVAESRSLCTAASVQSIPTDANQEDVVPMGMAAAFKTRRIMANTRRVVATELLCAAQGLEFLKPLTPGKGVQSVYQKVRGEVPALTEDRPQGPDVETIAKLLERENLV